METYVLATHLAVAVDSQPTYKGWKHSSGTVQNTASLIHSLPIRDGNDEGIVWI